MHGDHAISLNALLIPLIGTRRFEALLRSLEVHPSLLRPASGDASRAEIAMALALLLFEEVSRRVPLSRAYTQDAVAHGRKLMFDHGAVRTVDAFSGPLPRGALAITRLLLPLGFEQNGVYPLGALGMMGYAYAHRDLPEAIPQYFVSELQPTTFSPRFRAAVARVVANSADPLPPASMQRLEQLAAGGTLPLPEAQRLLPDLLTCFDRQHAEPSLSDYETLLSESQEMAWIATEGHAFNHATDRVADVAAVAESQRCLGRPVKEQLEVSRSGRITQTAFRAAQVERLFRNEAGFLVTRVVPGSFHEFITRQRTEGGRLDLSFDAGNAQSIFRMTSTEAAL